MKTQVNSVLRAICLSVPIVKALRNVVRKPNCQNIKLLLMCVGAAVSLGGAAKAANLVTNGEFADPSRTSSIDFVNNARTIPGWILYGSIPGGLECFLDLR